MSSHKEQFSIGDRVKVSDWYHWAKGALGTVKEPPDGVKQLVENQFESWKDCSRQVKGVRGLLTFFWVEFDEPHFDADGDGPYSEAEIESDFLSESN